MADLGVGQSFATTIFTEGQSTLEVARNLVFHARTKHIEVHHHYVRERFSAREIGLAYVPTQENIADLFTKALPREKFEAFRKALGFIHECKLLVHCITPMDLLIYLGSDVCEHTRTAGALFSLFRRFFPPGLSIRLLP
ncbi:hypothetical protein KP509_38G025600 [Ceratopteris richardii]|uniref:Uncharacterized protein n=1 Tax=Ceratopteris richardii TaxID=49495 RepID=A0A8T2Q389_CERRI|nr:hypothetical protein KP509_38G025600 [Ceratopteris richardii]